MKERKIEEEELIPHPCEHQPTVSKADWVLYVNRTSLVSQENQSTCTLLSVGPYKGAQRTSSKKKTFSLGYIFFFFPFALENDPRCPLII